MNREWLKKSGHPENPEKIEGIAAEYVPYSDISVPPNSCDHRYGQLGKRCAHGHERQANDGLWHAEVPCNSNGAHQQHL